MPELLRIKGELLLADGADRLIEPAETAFQGALDHARRQNSLSWELRAATSLARLKARQGRPDDARQILATVRDRFTEGFRTADWRAATALLESH